MNIKIINYAVLAFSLGIISGCAAYMTTGSSDTPATTQDQASRPDYGVGHLQSGARGEAGRQSSALPQKKIYFAPNKSYNNITRLTDLFESDYYQHFPGSPAPISDTFYPYDHITQDGVRIIDIDAIPPTTIAPSLPNLWDRIRTGFTLDHSHRGIRGDLRWYRKHQAYLDRVADRARPYLHMIVEEIERRGMPMELALLPIVESAFQPFAYSHGRAAGIWQFIPGTGKRFGLKQSWWYDGRRDIYASTRAALSYLEYLHSYFNGDWLLALAAYNSGEGTVRRAIRRNKKRGKPIDFWSLKLPRETRGYVPKLLAISAIVGDPHAHGMTLKSIADTQYLTKVDFKGQIDLALAAELAQISLNDIYRLNPGFNRWATDPDGPHYLLLPIERAEKFKENLANLPAEKRISWKRHRIRRGETLAGIAKRYQTTTNLLRQVNKIRGNRIRSGRNLIIPVARKKLNSYTLSANQRKKSIQNTRRPGRKITHIVQSGDTFWDLGRKYNVSVRNLAAWNSMAPRDPLKSGQRLVIWSHKADSTITGTSFMATPPLDQITRRINYIVRKGDSLARIARKFRVTIAQLRRWNSLRKGRYLQPGQRLKLFVDVTRQSG